MRVCLLCCIRLITSFYIFYGGQADFSRQHKALLNVLFRAVSANDTSFSFSLFCLTFDECYIWSNKRKFHSARFTYTFNWGICRTIIKALFFFIRKNWHEIKQNKKRYRCCYSSLPVVTFTGACGHWT